EDGEATALCEPLHVARRDAEPAAARPVRLAYDADHRVTPREQRLEDRTREGRRAHEDDAPGQSDEERAGVPAALPSLPVELPLPGAIEIPLEPGEAV